MKYTLYTEEDGTVIGYCNETHLLRWREGKGVESPTTPDSRDVYCVGCGKLLARRVE